MSNKLIKENKKEQNKRSLFESLLYLSPEQKKAYDKSLAEREELLKASPEYLKIMHKLDTVVYAGTMDGVSKKYNTYKLEVESDLESDSKTKSKSDITSYTSTLLNMIDKVFLTIRDEQLKESKDILINISEEIFDMICDLLDKNNKKEILKHVELELYVYKGMYLCVENVLKDYTFNVYTLKNE